MRMHKFMVLGPIVLEEVAKFRTSDFENEGQGRLWIRWNSTSERPPLMYKHLSKMTSSGSTVSKQLHKLWNSDSLTLKIKDKDMDALVVVRKH